MAADLNITAVTESLIGARRVAWFLTEPVCRSFGLLPVGLRDGVVTVAVTDASDHLVVELAQNLLGEDVELRTWSQDQLDRAFGAVFGDGSAGANGFAPGNGGSGTTTQVEVRAALREQFCLGSVDSLSEEAEEAVVVRSPEPIDTPNPARRRRQPPGWIKRCVTAMFWHPGPSLGVLEAPGLEHSELEGPELEGPELEGPEREGPEREGPEREGPEREGPELEGPGEALTVSIRRAVAGLNRPVGVPDRVAVPVRALGGRPARIVELTQRVQPAVIGAAAAERLHEELEAAARDADAELMTAAAAEAGRTLDSATAEAGRILDSATAEARRILDRATAESRSLLAGAEAQVEKLLSDGRSEHDAILARAEAEAQAVLAQVEAELDRGVGRIASLVDEIADIAGAAAQRTAAGAMNGAQVALFIDALGTATAQALAYIDAADTGPGSPPDPDEGGTAGSSAAAAT